MPLFQGVKTCQSQGFRAAKWIFVEPPQIEELRRRLESRGTESQDKIELRVQNAATELAASKEIHFDDRIVNDDLDKAYEKFKQAIAPELIRVFGSA